MNVPSGVVALAAVGLLAVLAGPATAEAASAVSSGWWTSAPVAVAPDVGDGQLLVQGGSDPGQPVAYAGISFALAPGEVPQKLVLSVAPNSATTPGAKVALCRLGAPASPAKGDAASGGPPFDCATKVESSPSSNGASYEFTVTGLGKEGALDIAVLPTQPTDRVVLTKPDVAALQSGLGGSTSPSPSAAPETAGAVPGAAGTDASGSADSTTLGGSTASVDLGGGGATTEPVSSAAPGPAATAAAGTDTPAVQLATPAASQQDSGSSRSLLPFAFGGMAAAAAALWALAGQQSPEAAGETGETSDVGEHQ